MDPILIPSLLSMGGQVLNNLTAGPTGRAGGDEKAPSFAAALERAEGGPDKSTAAAQATAQAWLSRLTGLEEVRKALDESGISPVSWRVSSDGKLYAIQSDRHEREIELSPESKQQVREIFDEAARSSSGTGNVSFSHPNRLEISAAGVLL